MNPNWIPSRLNHYPLILPKNANHRQKESKVNTIKDKNWIILRMPPYCILISCITIGRKI